MNGICCTANQCIWSIAGFIIAVFLVLIPDQANSWGQLCLLISLVLLIAAQIIRSGAIGSLPEKIIGPIAIALVLAGLILIWPSGAKILGWRFLQSLGATHG